MSPGGAALRLWNLVVFAAWIVGPFLLAGRGYAPGWVHLCAVLLAATLHGLHLRRANPELARRRGRVGAGGPRWDIAWNALFWPLFAAVALVAAAEARGGGVTLGPWAWAAGLLLLGAGFTLSAWAMAVNRHFEGTVRLQRELDHRVVEAGPYARVRHPGYAGLILWAAASPLLLRSRRALAAAGVVVAWIVLRTALEDRFLRRELGGYTEYARRTRWRLVPGLW